MTRSAADFQLEIEALRPDLDAFAGRLSADPGEAARLVSLVITAASEEASQEERAGDLRPWLFGLMRAAFHSVERRRRLDRTQRMPDRPWNAAQVAVYALTPRTP